MTTHTLPTPGPAKLRIELNGGRLELRATETSTTTVEVTGEQEDAVLVSQTGEEISILDPKRTGLFRRPDRYDVVVTAPSRSQLRVTTDGDVVATGTLRAAWVTVGRGDVRLDEVEGPLTVATGSGDIEAGRVSGEVRVKSGSGDITVDEATGPVSVVSASGDVTIGRAAAEVRVKTASGDLRVEVAEGGVSLATSSGDLTVGRAVRGRVTARSASGDTRLGIPAGTPIWTDVATVSGTVRTLLAPTGEPKDGQDHVELRARTASGDIVLEAV